MNANQLVSQIEKWIEEGHYDNTGDSLETAMSNMYYANPHKLAVELLKLPKGFVVETNQVGNLSILNSRKEFVGYIEVRSQVVTNFIDTDE